MKLVKMNDQFLYIKSVEIPSIIHRHEMYNIWQKTFPSNIVFQSNSDFDNFINNLNSPVFHIAFVKNEIAGFLISFLRDEKPWFIMSVSTKFQKMGLGRNLINLAKENNDELYGWVVTKDQYKLIDEKLYKSPLKFYELLDFKVNTNESFEAKGLNTIRVEWQKFKTTGK